MASDYLQVLETLVGDEGKLVTYKSLANRLGVDLNTSKRMLFDFAEKTEKKCHATYVLTGSSKKSGSVEILLVPQEKLDDSKNHFASFNVHVYSVEPSLPADPEALYLADIDMMRDPSYEPTKTACILNPAVKVVARPPRAPKPSVSAPPAVQTAKPSTSAAPEKKTETTSSKPGGISGFFGKAASSSSAKPAAEPKPVAKIEEKKPAAPAPAAKKVLKPEPLKQGKTVKKAADSDDDDEDIVIGKGKKRKVVADSDDDDEDDGGAMSEEEKNQQRLRAEKRAASDMDEDEEEDDDEDEDGSTKKKKKTKAKRKARSPSPKPEPNWGKAKVMEPVFDENGEKIKRKKRRRVVKQRSSVDEDGFLVTEDVSEMEEYTDDEPSPPPKPVSAFPPAQTKLEPIPPGTHKSAAPDSPDTSPQAKKAGKASGGAADNKKKDAKKGGGPAQKSLMSFFSKK